MASAAREYPALPAEWASWFGSAGRAQLATRLAALCLVDRQLYRAHGLQPRLTLRYRHTAAAWLCGLLAVAGA
jgi:hypothetical protein